MNRTRVLFLCTGNTARSQMAEAILRDRAGERFEAHSAGLEPTDVRPETIAVLEEIGVSTEGLRSKGVEEYLGKIHINYLITVCSHAEEHCPRIWPQGGERIFWPVDDPAVAMGSEEERLDAFRVARDHLVRLIEEWIAEP
ncbi:MAG: arsenate reductase ArsC [Coriobacteriia bacterium]|nr:arsenate reductase ArsC [Coriobacteriia bacterium]MBN2839389.1 arsenate reductase ArsC [Coriobacteriia bacterium]